jgi:hypothetical protein
MEALQLALAEQERTFAGALAVARGELAAEQGKLKQAVEVDLPIARREAEGVRSALTTARQESSSLRLTLESTAATVAALQTRLQAAENRSTMWETALEIEREKLDRMLQAQKATALELEREKLDLASHAASPAPARSGLPKTQASGPAATAPLATPSFPATNLAKAPSSGPSAVLLTTVLIFGGIIGNGAGRYVSQDEPATTETPTVSAPTAPLGLPNEPGTVEFEAAPFNKDDVLKRCGEFRPHPNGGDWRYVGGCTGLDGRTFACLFTGVPIPGTSAGGVAVLGCREEKSPAGAAPL